MNNDINLLSDINKALEREQRSAKILKIVGLISLIFVGLSSLAVFILGNQFSISSIEAEQKSVLQKISALNKKEAKVFIINNRLKSISDILSKRKDYYRITNSVLQAIPSGISVDKLTVDDKKISLMASSDSLLSLNTLISKLIEMAKRKEIITSLTLNSLSLNQKTSRYSVFFDADM